MSTPPFVSALSDSGERSRWRAFATRWLGHMLEDASIWQHYYWRGGRRGANVQESFYGAPYGHAAFARTSLG